MKPSFYFVIWIIIYPLLDLLNVEFINNHSFIIAIVIVFCLATILNRILGDTKFYDESITTAPILEDVFTGNVASFKKRLINDATLETIFSVYFILNIIAAIYIIILGTSSVLEIFIFGGLAYSAISKVISLRKGVNILNYDPTPERCMEIVEDSYRLDYTSYYNSRINASFEDALPPRPRGYQFYKIISIIFSIIATCLGAALFVLGVFFLVSIEYDGSTILGLIWLLYGSLAIYSGIKDTKQLVRSTKNRLYIAIGAVVAIIVAITCFIPSRLSQEISALKKEIAILNAECPSQWSFGQIKSVDFDEDNNKLTFVVILNEEYSSYISEDFNENNLNSTSVTLTNALANNTSNKEFLNYLIKLNIGFKASYFTEKSDKEIFSIEVTADEIKEFVENPPTNKQLITQFIDSAKLNCPSIIEEGIIWVDVFEEGNNVVFLYEVDEDLYDITLFLDYINENYGEIKNEMLSTPLLSLSIGVLKQTHKNLIYRYVGSNYEQALDITITPEEI